MRKSGSISFIFLEIAECRVFALARDAASGMRLENLARCLLRQHQLLVLIHSQEMPP